MGSLQGTVQGLQGQLAQSQALVAQLEAQVVQLQGQVSTVTTERDSARYQAEQAMALADTLQRAVAGTSMGDIMREFTRATQEAEFYRVRYHDAVPPE
jgi:phage shock protein A